MKIVISGTVGIGKSTLSKELFNYLSSKKDNVLLKKELDFNNPYLPLYYEAKYDWAFLTQIDFLLNRFKNSIFENSENKIVIYDRHFYDDYVFSTTKTIRDSMSVFNLNSYHSTFKILNNMISKKNSKIDHFILLRDSFENILQKMRKRSRNFEKVSDIDYWIDLYNSYYKTKKVINFFKANSKNFYIVDINDLTIEESLEKVKRILKLK